MRPVRVSPAPAVPRPALPVGLMNTRPPGVAMSGRDTFENKDDVMSRRKLARGRNTILECGFIFRAHQPQHLAGMRSQDQAGADRSLLVCRPGRERVEAVSVDHAWRVASLDDGANKAARTFIIGREPWPNRNDGRLFREFQKVRGCIIAYRATICFGQRSRDHFRHRAARDRHLRRRGRRDRHEAGADLIAALPQSAAAPE